MKEHAFVLSCVAQGWSAIAQTFTLDFAIAEKHLTDLDLSGEVPSDCKTHYRECQRRVLMMADRFGEGSAQHSRLMQVELMMISFDSPSILEEGLLDRI